MPALRAGRIGAPVIIVAVGLLALVGLGWSAPRAAAAGEYVALGDSYSSGVGTRDYIDDGTDCQRSTAAYPWVVADRIDAVLDFAACSGATTDSVRTGQLGGLDSGTQWVSVSAGGNDAGFTDVITECAQPAWLSDCNGAVDGAEAIITDVLPGRLDSLYSGISAGAPSAAVVVVGYPRLFMGEDCNAGTWFSPEDQARLNGAADLLDSTLAAKAAEHGFAFVDPRDAFTGHAVCDDVEWINGLSSPITESYHPNSAGHVGYADLVDAVV